MPDTPLMERQEALLQHLESVYLLAQAVSPDTAQATRLVQATYTQALVTPPLTPSLEEDKRWLAHLLLQIHGEQVELERFAGREEDPAAPLPPALQSLHRHLAQQITDRALPTVLATLSDEQRLILLLCDAEGFSSDETAFVLGLNPDTVQHRLEQTRQAVDKAVRADVSKQERRLLDQSLPADWLRPTLRRAVEKEFAPAPPSLRQAIISTLAPASPSEEPAPLTAPEAPSAALPEDESLPSPTPTAVEPISPPRPPAHTGSRGLRRTVVMVLLVLTVALLGYAATRLFQREPETNLIALSVEQADAVRPSLQTASLEQAEAFALTELAWRLTLPTIDRATLIGAGLREIAPDVTVPVFLYEDTLQAEAGRQITLYAVTDALLDRYGDRISLEVEILRQIQHELQFDLHDLGKRNALVWRNRDEIFIAVTPGDPDALRRRIVFPS